MRILCALLCLLPLAAAQEPKPAGQAKPEEKKEAAAPPQEAKPGEAKKEEAAESPAPTAESGFSGTLDVGYRFVSDVGGNFNSYRSIVDLGEGPKLTGLDFTWQDPKKRLFDRLDVRGNNWGGDPYNTARVDARKLSVYDFSFDYRNIAYFNFLPSFADPLLERGILLNERSFDIHRRVSEAQLTLRPGSRIVPFLAYSRNANFGRGITTFVSNSNEYPVSNQQRDHLDNYRGGVRFELSRFHATLEQGGTTFKDDQRVFFSDGPNPGNRTTPLGGETLLLTGLEQAYGIRGTSLFSRALVTASPVSWANLYGQFLFSQPETDVRWSQVNTGRFAVLSTLLFYNGQQDLVTADAKRPHTSGSVGAEIRPLRRLRIIESWMTDRFHNAAFSLLAERLLLDGGASQQPAPVSLGDRLVMNYNQQQVDALFDITSRLTLRGGHRYVWGDAQVAASPLTPVGEMGEIRRHVGLAGLMFRSGQKLSVTVDFEGASSQRNFFRTSLNDYRRLRARARYQAMTSLSLNADFAVLSNENPSPGVNYDFLSRDNSLSLFWTPAGGKRVTVLAEYSRSSLRSDISYLAPPFFDPERSFYRDNAHSSSVLVDLALPSYAKMTPRLSVGGALFASSGSRPTRYYQPNARLQLPLHKHVYWTSEWRWYGFGERFYLYEGFRAHLFMTGLRFTR